MTPWMIRKRIGICAENRTRFLSPSIWVLILASTSLYCAAENAQPTLILQAGHRFPVTRLDMTRDGKTLASSDFNGVIKLWDVPSGQELFTLNSNDEPMQSWAGWCAGLRSAAGSAGTFDLQQRPGCLVERRGCRPDGDDSGLLPLRGRAGQRVPPGPAGRSGIWAAELRQGNANSVGISIDADGKGNRNSRASPDNSGRRLEVRCRFTFATNPGAVAAGNRSSTAVCRTKA